MWKRLLRVPNAGAGLVLFVGLSCLAAGCGSLKPDSTKPRPFAFVVTSDTRQFTGPAHPGKRYFEGVCEAIRSVGEGQFMISPGDVDPPAPIRATLDRFFGTNYLWYPVVGNHEAETPADMEWLRAWGSNAIPGLVRRGPTGCETTTYSFDYAHAHFVVLNQYYNGTTDTGAKGDIAELLFAWLERDLQANRKPLVFVIGHEPIKPMPDMDNQRLRHEKDSLNAYPESAARFHTLLRRYKVPAYLCAHTHNTSLAELDGVWQIDSGHARGAGDPGAPSTFVRFAVGLDGFEIQIYREDAVGSGTYRLTKTVPVTVSRLASQP